MTLTRLEFQPDFPTKDISNRTIIGVADFFSDPERVAITHELSENDVLYSLGHRALVKAAEPHFTSEELEAFSDGIASYEVLSAVVRPMIPRLEMSTVLNQIQNSENEIGSPQFPYTLTDQRIAFEEETPNVAGIIGTQATSHGGQLNHLVIGGAAFARRTEIEALGDFRLFEAAMGSDSDFAALEQQFRDLEL